MKTTLQDIIEKVAAQTNSTKKLSEDFLRELLQIIEEALNKEDVAKVKGLGTFRRQLVEERKSVNIHSGEEIIIPAHYKISFAPDKELKTAVNKPYAHLETYILSKEGPVDQPATDDEEEDAAEEMSVSIEEKAEDAINAANDQRAEVLKTAETIVVEEDKTEIVNSAETEAIMPPSIPEIEDEIATPPPIPEIKAEMITPPPIPEIGKSNNDGEEKETDNKEEEKEGDTEEKEKKVDKDEEENEDEDDETPKKAKKKIKAGWIIFWSLLLLIIVTFVLYWFSDKIIEKFNIIPALTEQTQPVPEPEVKPENTLGKSENTDENANNPGQISSLPTQTNYVVDPHFDSRLVEFMKQNYPEMKLTTEGSPQKVTLQSGQRLTLLALRNYGNKQFWVYIYLYNSDIITDPNNVPTGLEIQIPDLDPSLISNDQTHVNAALDVQKRLLKL